MEGAYQTRQLDGRARPVDARFLLVQLVRVGRQGIVLRLACQRTGLQSGNRLDHCLRAELGEPIMQAAAGILSADRCADLEQHRPGIQTGFHLHHGDPGFGIARLDGALDRRRTAPAWQQRGVAVDAAQTRHVEHRLRQDQAIGDHHHQIGPQRGQLRLGIGVAQGLWLMHGNVVADGELLDRTGH